MYALGGTRTRVLGFVPVVVGVTDLDVNRLVVFQGFPGKACTTRALYQQLLLRS